MELEFSTADCKYVRSVLREVRNQELTQEIRLSDGMPDIGRVLASWGQVILRSKEWRGDVIGCSGGIMLWVLYAPEDGTDCRCVESWLPFQTEWDLQPGTGEGAIQIRALLRFADARSVSARKLTVRCGIGVQAEALVAQEARIPVPHDTEPDIQLLHNVYPLRLNREVGEKSFQLDEDLSLPDSRPQAEKLLCYTVNPEIAESRVSGKRLILKGKGNLHILYRAEAGELCSWRFELPFSQLINLEENWEDDPEATLDLSVTNLELTLDDMGHFRLKLGLLAQFRVSCRQMITAITDAYSVSREVMPVIQAVSLPVILENRQESIYGEVSLPQNAEGIVDVCFLPDFPRLRRMGEQTEVEIPGQLQVLYYGQDGVLQSANARWDGSLRLTAHTENQLSVSILPENTGSTISGSGQILLKPEVTLGLESGTVQEIPMAAGLQVGQLRQKDPNRPSLILRRAGDAGLWDIAKTAGISVASLMQANGLTDEPQPDQILLIPVS